MQTNPAWKIGPEIVFEFKAEFHSFFSGNIFNENATIVSNKKDWVLRTYVQYQRQDFNDYKS